MKPDSGPLARPKSDQRDPSWHLPTAIALGALSWLLLMVGHEVVGHGTGCLAVGGEALYFDAMYFQCTDLPRLWQDQVYRAAGSLFNLLLVAVSVLGLRFIAARQTWTGYFLWVTAVTNALHAGSYIGFGRFIHPGMDWAMIVAAAPNPWGLLTTGAGVSMIGVSIWVGWKYQPFFVPHDGSSSWPRLRLLLTPCLTATVVSVTASLLVPSDDRLMMLMGGVGNSLFFLCPMLLISCFPAKAAGRGLALPANRVVIIAAVLATSLYLLFMAPGVTLE